MNENVWYPNGKRLYVVSRRMDFDYRMTEVEEKAGKIHRRACFTKMFVSDFSTYSTKLQVVWH